MQSTLQSSSISLLIPLSRKSPDTENIIFRFPKLSARKTLELSKSVNAPVNFELDGVLEDEPVPGNRTRLPIVIKRSGRVSRYLKNGDCLELVCVDGGATSFCVGLDDGFRKLLRFSSLAVRDFFIPKQVEENYLRYVKWKFLHRLFSSALQVLATQAMFRAIGIGQSRSLPSAAAFNWILKEGLGRLSRCIYTASLASAFDTNLKRVRFLTSIVFSLSIGVELLTPMFPQYFLLLASIANIAKQISLSCYLATGSAVHRSFAIADNLGEVSAKAQIQTVCFDNLGLLLAAVLDRLVKSNQRLQACLPFVVYPLFSTIDLLGIYQGLKHVHLLTLTKDRLEIILEKWIEFRGVPSPSDVSKEEGVDLVGGKDGKRFLPIRIGCLDPKGQIPRLSMVAMESLSSEDYYFISMELVSWGLTRTLKPGIVVCLREGASTADIIRGLLQACHMRKTLRTNDIWMKRLSLKELTAEDWWGVMRESKGCARDEFSRLYEQMEEGGWAIKNVLLSKEEQVRFSFVR